LLLLGGDFESQKIDGLRFMLLAYQPGQQQLGLRNGMDIAEKDDSMMADGGLEKLEWFRGRRRWTGRRRRRGRRRGTAPYCR
jgi:hypothetical protein